MTEPLSHAYDAAPDYWAARKAARLWRCSQGNDRYLTTGLVRVFDGRVYGWSAELGTARTERPGALAIDAQGNIWQAHGGDVHGGTTTWDEIKEPPYPGL